MREATTMPLNLTSRSKDDALQLLSRPGWRVPCLLLASAAICFGQATPPTVQKTFFVDAFALNSTTVIDFTLQNPGAGTLTGISFTDPLPAGLVVASPNGLSNGCGGSVTANPNASSIVVSGVSLNAGDSCDIFVSLLGTTSGTKTNTTGIVTSDQATGATSNTVTVIVVQPPLLIKSFGAPSIAVNGTTTLNFTISNQSDVDMDNLAFTDALPAGLVVASPTNGLSGSCFTAGGLITNPAVVTADPGSGEVDLITLGLVAHGSCSFSVNVTGTSGGTKDNTTSEITGTFDSGGGSSAGITGSPASASITVNAPDLSAVKTNNATASQIVLGGSWTWNIHIANGGNASASFSTGQTILTDNLPGTGIAYGPVNGAPAAVTCIIASNTLSCTANAPYSLAAGGSFDISFTATPTQSGTFVNPTGGICQVDPNNVTGDGNLSNNNCSNTVLVLPPPVTDQYQVGYAANLAAGDSYVNLTNSGVLNGFDPAGRICVNVYTFDPSEELVSCCSCPVTPDGLKSLSVKQDLVSNTLTPGVPGSVVIKLLATDPAGAPCNAAAVTTTNLEGGMRAWGTSLHQNTASGRFEITENVFQASPLSASELSKLTTYCGFIQSNGSGFGICKSCRVGGLGGAQQ
jgi:uncharacterized repeat protein (TIGR01451 family)